MGKILQQHAYIKDFSHFAFKQNPTCNRLVLFTPVLAAGPSQRGDSSSERAPSLPHLSPLDQNARMWGQL